MCVFLVPGLEQGFLVLFWRLREAFWPLPNNERGNFMFSEVLGYHGAILRGLAG